MLVFVTAETLRGEPQIAYFYLRHLLFFVAFLTGQLMVFPLQPIPCFLMVEMTGVPINQLGVFPNMFFVTCQTILIIRFGM